MAAVTLKTVPSQNPWNNIPLDKANIIVSVSRQKDFTIIHDKKNKIISFTSPIFSKYNKRASNFDFISISATKSNPKNDKKAALPPNRNMKAETTTKTIVM